MDLKDIMDLNRFNYPNSVGSSSEFIVDLEEPYIPMLSPSLSNTRITSILPVEGEDVGFSLSKGRIHVATEYSGFLVGIQQDSGGVSGQKIDNFMGHKVRLSLRLEDTILDGGFIERTGHGNVRITDGICRINGLVRGFSGILLSLYNKVNSVPRGYGVGFIVMLTSGSTTDGGLIIPDVRYTDLINTQIQDYSTMYASIRQEIGMDYSDSGYIELCRGQMMNQLPSTPFTTIRMDQRMRSNSVNFYR